MASLPHSLIRAVRRQRLVMAGVLVAALAAAGAASVLIPPTWRAGTTVMLRQNADGPLGLGLLGDPDLHRKVVERLGAATLYPGRSTAEAAEAFGRDLDARLDGNGGLLRIEFDSANPLLATRVLESTLAVLAEERTARLSQDDGRDLAYRQSLEDARARLEAYRRSIAQTPPVDVAELGRMRAETAAEIGRLEDQRSDLERKIAAIETQRATLAASAEEPAPDQTGRYQVVDDAKARLFELKVKEQELLTRYTETSQVVTGVRDQIRAVQALIDTMAPTLNARPRAPKPDTNALSRDLSRLQTQQAAATGHIAVLSRQLAETDRKLGNAANGIDERQRLEDAVAAAEADLRRLDAERNAPNGDIAGMTLVEKPFTPSRPAMPRPLLYMALGLMAGLIGGLGAAMVADSLSKTFADAEEIERRLGLPVLSTIPERA